MSNDIDVSLRKIISHYGFSHQLKKLNEEIWELNEAILRFKDTGDIAEEMADCYVLLEQIRMYYQISRYYIYDIMQQKVERQLKRIEEESSRVRTEENIKKF